MAGQPLIAAALMMQDKDFGEVVSRYSSSPSIDLLSEENRIDLLVEAFGESATVISVGERMAYALRELFRDLGRATSDSETAAAFERFGDNWHGRDDRVATTKKCPDCDGTGKIDSKDCQKCGGTGRISI